MPSEGSALKIIGFLPCRAGSERVKDKNTRQFAGFENGLLELKLRQLSAVSGLNKIIVSSNDSNVLEYAAWFRSENDERVVPLPRPDHYGSSGTSMGKFIEEYISELEQDGLIFWTHVTHPLITSKTYNECIRQFPEFTQNGYDSVVSATKLQKFLWRDGMPLNYDNSVEKWPRSQDIDPVWEINHGIYMLPFSLMRERKDRIGANPYFYSLPESEALDIDWQEQFDLLEEIVRARAARGIPLL